MKKKHRNVSLNSWQTRNIPWSCSTIGPGCKDQRIAWSFLELGEMSSWSLSYNTYFDFISTDISHFRINSNMWQENRYENGWTDIFKGCVPLACFWDIIIYSSDWRDLIANQKRLKNTISICRNSAFLNFLFLYLFYLSIFAFWSQPI